MIDAIVSTMTPRRLLSTGDAADTLGVHRATLNRWKTKGYVTPTSTTLGGHDRWDLNDLRQQIEDWRRSAAYDPEDDETPDP